MMANPNILLMLFIMVFSHLHFYLTSSSNSSCIETEWKALMDFKGSLDDRQNLLSSWTGLDCCSWYGITCHGDTGFVQTIRLSSTNNAFGGHINSSLLNLEHLEELDLSYNDFLGIQIPEFLGSLKNLQYLNLYGAGFSGEIPQHLGNLSNLINLILGEDSRASFLHNREVGDFLSSTSLDWFAGLSSLRYLELSYINLSECANWLDSINMLSSLKSLKINDCGLVGMSLSRDLNLTSLVSIDLTEKNLNSTLPPSFFNLSSLEDINIANCSLRGPIPNMFQKLTNLSKLDLSLNSFESSLPDSLCALTGLTSLSLSRSKLRGSIPSCLGNLTSLAGLELGSNELSGTIPDELGSLTQLNYLRLGDNRLSGGIPSTLSKLTGLQTLDVSKNSLTGELSESFFEGVKGLQSLHISRNKFIVLNVTSQWIPPFQFSNIDMDYVFMGLGTPFPTWLQTQTRLSSLSLRNTSISGVIPDWCQTSYPNLRTIDLSNNFLTGPVPTFNVVNKATMTYLTLSNNRFTGNIPDELCNLRSLVFLKLANNQLIGKIPSCLGNLWELAVLDLANNSLSDNIPSELGYLNKLFILHLNGNRLLGELPSSLQNLIKLRTFDVSRNELHGLLPNWIGEKLLNLENLVLQSNNFYGEISTNLCQLTALQILDLGDNSFVGTIPSCLGNLINMASDEYKNRLYMDDTLLTFIKGLELEYSSNLRFAKFMSLSGNHLHGEIPDELMDLKGLQSLNLSNNELTGKIPERIGNMKSLGSLDLSMNQLSGTIPQSLGGIDSLGYLNLSFNRLSGRIPSGGHIDTLSNAAVYEGNDELCDIPTGKRCDDDLQNGHEYHGGDEFEVEWIYAGIGPGFAVGFLGVFCLLYFKSSWRYALFRFLENVYNRF